MYEDSVGQGYLTRGIALAVENSDFEQQIGFLAQATGEGLPLPETAIGHGLLMRCYAYHNNLESALQELRKAREALGTALGYQGDSLVRFACESWIEQHGSEAEDRLITLLLDKETHQPWYRLLFSSDTGLIALYMTPVDSVVEDMAEQRRIKLKWMRRWPDIDDLRFFLGYRYFAMGETGRAVAEFRRATDVGAIKWRTHKYHPRHPYPPEYSLPFRTILGLIYKEQGDVNRAIEQWRIVVQVDPVWLYVKDQCGPICAPIVNFWLDQAKQHLLESLPSHEVMEILAQASSEEYSVERAERYKQKMVLIESLRMKDL